MSRRADHDARRRRIGEALWRIAASRGLHDVGLREIATEAGVSLGALQHYFPSKEDMLVFTLHLVGQEADRRVRERLAALDGPPSPESVVRETLAEMLPLGPTAGPDCSSTSPTWPVPCTTPACARSPRRGSRRCGA